VQRSHDINIQQSFLSTACMHADAIDMEIMSCLSVCHTPVCVSTLLSSSEGISRLYLADMFARISHGHYKDMACVAFITGCAVAQHCCNDDQQSQRKTGILTPVDLKHFYYIFITKIGSFDYIGATPISSSHLCYPHSFRFDNYLVESAVVFRIPY